MNFSQHYTINPDLNLPNIRLNPNDNFDSPTMLNSSRTDNPVRVPNYEYYLEQAKLDLENRRHELNPGTCVYYVGSLVDVFLERYESYIRLTTDIVMDHSFYIYLTNNEERQRIAKEIIALRGRLSATMDINVTRVIFPVVMLNTKYQPQGLKPIDPKSWNFFEHSPFKLVPISNFNSISNNFDGKLKNDLDLSKTYAKKSNTVAPHLPQRPGNPEFVFEPITSRRNEPALHFHSHLYTLPPIRVSESTGFPPNNPSQPSHIQSQLPPASFERGEQSVPFMHPAFDGSFRHQQTPQPADVGFVNRYNQIILPPLPNMINPAHPTVYNPVVMSPPRVHHKVSEVHFFKHPYVLVEDVSGEYKPVIVAEFLPSKDVDVPWPQLWQVPPSRCPYIRNSTKAKKNQMSKMCLTQKHRLKMEQMRALERSELSSITGNDSQYRAKRMCIGGAGDQSTSVVHRLRSVPNHLLYLEKPMEKGTSFTSRVIRAKISAPLTPANVKKPGFCENCKVKYADIDSHVLTRPHRNFAAKSSNFSRLDRLIGRLQRKPNPKFLQNTFSSLPSRLDSHISSSPQHSSANPHWYGKSATDYAQAGLLNPPAPHPFAFDSHNHTPNF